MLRFRTHPKSLLSITHWIKVPIVRARMWDTDPSRFVELPLRVDSGADYTQLPLHVAPRLGISLSALRRSGSLVTFRSSSDHRYNGYLWPIHFGLADDVGAVAEWLGRVAFIEPPAVAALAGIVGFLEFFDYAVRDKWLELEPNDTFPQTP